MIQILIRNPDLKDPNVVNAILCRVIPLFTSISIFILVKERVFNDMQCHTLVYLFTKLQYHHMQLEENYYNDAIKFFMYYLIE